MPADAPEEPRVAAAQCRPSTLAGELRVALAKSTRRIRSRRGAADLPDPQFNVLAILLREGPLTPGALAEAEHVQPPSMTRTVNALVGLGFVAKSEHPTDGRQVVVSLTDAGRPRSGRPAAAATRGSPTSSNLTPDERRTLAQAAVLLRRIAAG
ncbi:MarR family transcriptional regulator [Cellulomonas sp. ES6]|uniref:MarR family winged helix-turn-helix transcriptional regulator n=1 Tax=Cellulomonas sp. ES6 TaxID=3039384 RepID=UPI0032D590EC